MVQQPPAYQPVFVGGAPRTGTTLLHALICTSPRVNDYVAECSYFSAFLNPYLVGLGAFNHHTRSYFDSQDAFRDFHTSILRTVLDRIWLRTLKPQILALKDPMLTKNFHILAQLLPDTKFIIAIRDPRDAVLSVLEGLRLLNSGNTDEERLRVACMQYVEMYRSILDHRATFGDRLIFIDYNRLVVGGELEKLAAFGISDISQNKVWHSDITDVNDHVEGDPWWSALYGQQISVTRVGRHAAMLGPDMIDIIRTMCGDVFAQCGVYAG